MKGTAIIALALIGMFFAYLIGVFKGLEAIPVATTILLQLVDAVTKVAFTIGNIIRQILAGLVA